MSQHELLWMDNLIVLTNRIRLIGREYLNWLLTAQELRYSEKHTEFPWINLITLWNCVFHEVMSVTRIPRSSPWTFSRFSPSIKRIQTEGYNCSVHKCFSLQLVYEYKWYYIRSREGSTMWKTISYPVLLKKWFSASQRSMRRHPLENPNNPSRCFQNGWQGSFRLGTP